MLQWELLVTDGHVRAARWRAAAKYIVGIGVGLIALGLVGLWIVPESSTPSRIAEAKQELVTERVRALATFVRDKGAPPRVLPASAANALTPNDAIRMFDRLADNFNKTNALPPEIKSIDPATFWSGNWMPGAIAAVTADRTVLVAFYVNQAVQRQTPPQLRRVFGLFRRSADNKTWSFRCLMVPQAALCGRGEPVAPETISDTLRSLTPDDAR